MKYGMIHVKDSTEAVHLVMCCCDFFTDAKMGHKVIKGADGIAYGSVGGKIYGAPDLRFIDKFGATLIIDVRHDARVAAFCEYYATLSDEQKTECYDYCCKNECWFETYKRYADAEYHVTENPCMMTWPDDLADSPITAEDVFAAIHKAIADFVSEFGFRPDYIGLTESAKKAVRDWREKVQLPVNHSTITDSSIAGLLLSQIDAPYCYVSSPISNGSKKLIFEIK